jgi:5-methyltetrahydrofolate--homocysteine methyltransferase
VGVVLACNNYEIVDMGVMVPVEKILAKAKEINADIIGLSGLITPSLDEMITVAEEMEKQNFHTPLLIGGATTSRIHAAVKIAPMYSKPVVHVLDASRSVPVAGSLLNTDKKEAFALKIKEEYKTLAEDHAKRQKAKNLIPFGEAVANKFPLDLSPENFKMPKNIGVQTVAELDLSVLRKYIDWTPFFQTWELHGKYPRILEDGVVGVEAKKVFNDANDLLDEIIEKGSLKANGVFGLFPANSVDGEVEVYTNEDRTEILENFHFLRQQGKKGQGIPNISLADFVAPKDSGIKDYFGAFAVTTGVGLEEIVLKFKEDHDDYNAIMAKALADRLAEAFAEYLHEQIRKEHWAYANEEVLEKEELIREKYRGIRPAPGYPACPDHTEKGLLWNLLNVEKNAGIQLTESYAMQPGAAVSGFYFAHPQSKYFGLGKINKDQLAEYAKNKQYETAVMEKWLRPNLGY